MIDKLALLLKLEFICSLICVSASSEEKQLTYFIMELRSGSVSGASNENIDPNVNLVDMVEDIWKVIEKRVGLFLSKSRSKEKNY